MECSRRGLGRRLPDYRLPGRSLRRAPNDGPVVFVGGHLLGLLSAAFFGETVEHVTEAKISLPLHDAPENVGLRSLEIETRTAKESTTPTCKT